MSAFASYNSPLSSPNVVLPPVNTTGTGGSTYKYESAPIHGGYTSSRRKPKRGTKSQKNKKRGGKTHNKKSRKSQKK
jgi:hypothetical protein